MKIKILKKCKLYSRELAKDEVLDNVHREDAKRLIRDGKAREVSDNPLTETVNKVKDKFKKEDK